MSNIVQQTSKSNHVTRSSFDLSGNVNFTAAPGMLIPLRVDEVLPNSSYQFDFSLFARTIQMAVPSFARVRAHVDTFFVPYRLLGSDFQSVIVGDERGQMHNYTSKGIFDNLNSGLPYFDLAYITTPGAGDDADKRVWDFGAKFDAAGVACSTSSPILLNALGYGVPNIGSINMTKLGTYGLGTAGSINSAASATDVISSGSAHLSPLYLLAYQKIYQDYYRNKLWEKENKSSYFITTANMGADISNLMLQAGSFEMRYHDYDKDRLTGLIPDENGILSEGISQYASSILNGRFGIDSVAALGKSQIPSSGSSVVDVSTGSINKSTLLNGVDSSTASPVSIVDGVVTAGNNAVIQQYTALTNRRMEAFQKFAEITQLNRSDYKHQVQAHFGFTPNDLNSDYAQMLGSFDVPLSISDVENTTDTDQGYLAGKGVMSGQSRTVSFNSSEHGCIMSIFYILPQIDWSNEFIDRANLRFNRYDFAIPEFDRLGFEPVRVLDWFGLANVFGDALTANSVFDIIGYLPRYWSYKTRLDVNATGFTNSSKSALNFDSYVVKYDKQRLVDALKDGSFFEAIKSRPNDLDGLFPVKWTRVQDNPFVITAYIKATGSLPLSIDSLPY